MTCWARSQRRGGGWAQRAAVALRPPPTHQRPTERTHATIHTPIHPPRRLSWLTQPPTHLPTQAAVMA